MAVLAVLGGSAAADEVFRPRLADNLIAEAAAFQSYILESQTISADFRDGAQIQRSLTTAGAYNHQQLMRGAVVLGAIAALQEPSFVAGLRAIPAERRPMMADLIARNPWMVATLAGAPAAAARVNAAVAVPAARLTAAGAAVKQSAYDVQHQAWSKQSAPDHRAILLAAQTLADLPRKATDVEIEQVRGLLAGGSGSAPAPSDLRVYPRLTARALALAAMAVLDQAGEEKADLVTYAIAEPDSDQCLRMAKLNLFQCLAVAGPHYEDIFCLAQHLMIDTGQCVTKEFGVPMTGPAAPLAATETLATP